MRSLSILPVLGLPEIDSGDDLIGLLGQAVEQSGGFEPFDVLVVSQKVVSKAEGRIRALDPDDPSAHESVVLDEAVRVVRRRGDLIITETAHGFICANSGVDRSNVAAGNVVLLPRDPDRSAYKIRDALRAKFEVELAVIVSDTFGRPWRRGVVDVALGCAGLLPILDVRGTVDSFGNPMTSTEICIADQVASAAELVKGKTSGIAAVIVRGVDPEYFGNGSVRSDVIRPVDEDLFR